MYAFTLERPASVADAVKLASAGGKPVADAETLLGEGTPDHARPTLAWSLKISAICLILWFGPILVLDG